MPISHTFDVARKTILIIMSGRIAEDDFIKKYGSLKYDPNYKSEYSILVDTSLVEKFVFDTSIIRKTAASNMFPKAHRHVIVAPTDYLFAMARMFQMAAAQEGHNIQVFRTIKEAKAWLYNE